ncbi:Uncharacterized protein dnm_033790 [Desulfonema magnum]|uniref:Uncharacterized protein n=1 Tax=Desulfonema magnum TaxID=45655 RepID=A0A975BL90_9BACT|nr:Uncharacterized protein dnm_033790 [Desulfonema magnum]
MKNNSGLFFATKTRRLKGSRSLFVALRACLKNDGQTGFLTAKHTKKNTKRYENRRKFSPGPVFFRVFRG